MRVLFWCEVSGGGLVAVWSITDQWAQMMFTEYELNVENNLLF